MAAWPVDPEALRALWRGGKDRSLAVAVSGGGDSLALLALLRQAAADRPVVAVIIDHAVQDGSAIVAAQAAARAEALGARAEVRRLNWSGPAPRDQASAREARYRALAEAARGVGADTIAVAHTLEDQAETALLKWSRSGRWGEAGMRALSPCPVWPDGLGLWLARPLLGVRRDQLRDWARAQGLFWHDDPANANPAYARVRARAILAADPGLSARLAAHASLAADRAARRQAAALAWVEDAARFDDPEGAVAIDRLPADRGGLTGLAALLGAVAGGAPAATPEAVMRLAAALRAGAAAQTLGGAVVRRLGCGFVIDRDPGALLGRSGVAPQPPIPLVPGTPVLVDGRIWLVAKTAGYEAVATRRARWALRRNGHWIALDASEDVTVRWLTVALVRHILAPVEPIAGCDGFKGVQQALGLLS
jgi:tRNA(Ile)-lysidine synthase